ncbi:hypothetical protein FBQ97_00075 [Acidobacteria bacterium ACD]|nr:MAG: hypothetical protein EDX89_05535 [Acidobacteriota bacterium]MCE7956477.1 hypothetical protein [Acidobacteria bacterium ACB2]MDL1948201.1 hypothetical protein [Acidobacteria bacterium ACD]
MHLLTQTSAMPGSSFSLPARLTCPGSLLEGNSVCRSCYADGRKRYRWRTVRKAQELRFGWTLEALSSGRFVTVLADRISWRGERYFRLHDAGDFFSPAYVEAWYEIALELPGVSFWAPTKSWAVRGCCRPDDDSLLSALRRLASLPNVTVRPSALMIGGDPPVVPGLAAGSAVTRDRSLTTCPKDLRSPPACRDCRRCWDEPDVPVTYLER